MYIWSRPAPSNPPTPPLATEVASIRQDLICSYAILACWPRATYALHNRIPPCSVHYCLQYAHTIYLQGNTANRVIYSSIILATIKTSCAIHTCWPRTTYTLST